MTSYFETKIRDETVCSEVQATHDDVKLSKIRFCRHFAFYRSIDIYEKKYMQVYP